MQKSRQCRRLSRSSRVITLRGVCAKRYASPGSRAVAYAEHDSTRSRSILPPLIYLRAVSLPHIAPAGEEDEAPRRRRFGRMVIGGASATPRRARGLIDARSALATLRSWSRKSLAGPANRTGTSYSLSAAAASPMRTLLR